MGLTNLQPLAYAFAYVSFFFGTLSIFLRFYCRRYILHLWGWDDNFAFLILVCMPTHCTTAPCMTNDEGKRYLALASKSCCTCFCTGVVDCTVSPCWLAARWTRAHQSCSHIDTLTITQKLEITKVC